MNKLNRILNTATLTIAAALFLIACGAPMAPGADSSAAGEPIMAAPAAEQEMSSADAASAEYAAPTSAQSSVVAASSAAVSSAVPAETSQSVVSTGNINDAPYDATFFEDYGVNPFVDTADDHLSTFAMDVDTAAYTVARRFIQDGNMPDPASVRTEEFINYFKHDYTPPTEGAFSIHLEGAPSHFGAENTHLVRVGLQGKVIRPEERQDVALTFVVDVSGSMDREDRLVLAKRSLNMLVEELRPTDSVAIVVYGSTARTVLQPTMATDSHKNQIIDAIYSLGIEGSTNAEAGLRMAYDLAWGSFNQQANNRVILISDGVANVGATGPASIWAQIEQYAEKGITMTSVGVGMGNYNDVLMEQLANNGNGSYAYVDTIDEARRIFVDELTGTLQTIAMDAKVQVDFNPDVVASYRLMGYENRAVADEDFRNDAEDAGEVGAGHSVTALYEVKLNQATKNDATIATVFIRYQDPALDEVVEVSQVLLVNQLQADFWATSDSFQLDAAVAEYAEILKESYWAQEGTLGDVLEVAANLELSFHGQPQANDVAEFVDLVDAAERISSAQARR